MTGQAEIERFVRSAHDLLAAAGDTRAATLVEGLRAPQRAKPALFVVGEDKRGKSCLVNALVGVIDASPVGVEVTTGSPVTMFHAAERQGMVFRYGEPRPSAMPYDEARTLATVSGNPGNRENIRTVALGLDSPLLAQVNVVDTPGVGGLNSGHGELTMQALGSADALVFCLEAGAPIREPELRFLERASERVDTVILALTKTDLHRGWQQILDDDLAILRDKVPRLASSTVVPVSSLLALRGIASGDETDAAELRTESGIARLEATILGQVVRRAGVLRDANVVRSCENALAHQERRARDELDAMNAALGKARDDAAAGPTLDDQRRRLQGLAEDKADWVRRLDGEVRKITLERSEAASRATVDVRRRYEVRLRELDPDEMEGLPGELVADLTAIAAQLDEQAAVRLGQVIEEILAELGDEGSLREVVEGMGRSSLQWELQALALDSPQLTAGDKLSVLASFTSGRAIGSLGGIFASTLIAPVAGLVVGLGVGGLFAFHAFRSRNRQLFTQEFMSWMGAQIQQALVTINTSFQRRMIDVQAEVRDGLQAAFSRRERELADTMQRSQQLLGADAAEQQAAMQAVADRIRSVMEVRRRGLELLTALRAGTTAAAGALPSSATGAVR